MKRKLIVSLLLIMALCVFSTIPLAAAAFRFPISIERRAYTGEHFMHNRRDDKESHEQKVFRELFDKEQLQFIDFEPVKKLELSTYHLGSKTRIGRENYELRFFDRKSLLQFAREKLPAVPEISSLFNSFEESVFLAIRDHALSKKDRDLIQIFEEKFVGTDYAGSAFEEKRNYYEPFLARALFSKKVLKGDKMNEMIEFYKRYLITGEDAKGPEHSIEVQKNFLTESFYKQQLEELKALSKDEKKEGFEMMRELTKNILKSELRIAQHRMIQKQVHELRVESFLDGKQFVVISLTLEEPQKNEFKVRDYLITPSGLEIETELSTQP